MFAHLKQFFQIDWSSQENPVGKSGSLPKGGGQTCFLNFWNKLTLNWHNFFCFWFKFQILEEGQRMWPNFTHTQPIFWLLAHSIDQKFLSAPKSAFSPTWWPAPFIFFLIMDLRKKNFFLFKVWTYVFGKHTT